MELTEQQNRNREIAKIIMDQLGKSTLFMLGAKDFIAIENGLLFSIRGSHKANRIRITLMPSDTYKMEFIRVRALKINPVKTFDVVYCDQLHELIEEVTGLCTKMPRIIGINA